MKTYKQFNEQTQQHLHEVDRMNFGIPGSGLLMKGLGYLAKPAVYRTLGTMETGHQLYKDIKNKKPIGKTIANTAGNLLTTFAPYEKGFLKALRSKRFVSGVGLNLAGYDEKSDNNQTSNKTNSNNSKFSDIRGGDSKVDGYGKPKINSIKGVANRTNVKPKKYLTDLDLYKK